MIKFEDMNKEIFRKLHVFPVCKYKIIQGYYKSGQIYIYNSKNYFGRMERHVSSYRINGRDDDITEIIQLSSFENTPVEIFLKMGFDITSITLRKLLFLQSYIKGDCQDYLEFELPKEINDEIDNENSIQFNKKIVEKNAKIQELYSKNKRLEDEISELKRKLKQYEKTQKEIMSLKDKLNTIDF